MTTKSASGPFYADVVVVTCSCGMLPLERATHRDAQSAWQAAAAHVALNPTKCKPNMFRDAVPAGLAARI
jgi:hypothetical protein